VECREPEARLPFDSFAGEPRNSDLLVLAHDVHGPYVLAAEARADEPYGETVADAFADALERRIANPRSNVIARIVGTRVLLLGARQPGHSRSQCGGPSEVPHSPGGQFALDSERCASWSVRAYRLQGRSVVHWQGGAEHQELCTRQRLIPGQLSERGLSGDEARNTTFTTAASGHRVPP